MKLKVTKLDYDFVKNETEYERYVFASWNNVSNILRNEADDKDERIDNIECIVKISNGKNKVYRKCRSGKIVKEQIAMGYRTALELGVKQDKDEEVVVKKSCWFPYLWHHVDSTIKWPFRLAFLYALPTLFETIMNIINIFK